jgi:hypothetical protein
MSIIGQEADILFGVYRNFYVLQLTGNNKNFEIQI